MHTIRTSRLALIGISLLVVAAAWWLLRTEPPVSSEPLFPSVDAQGSPVLAVFEGRIPCTGCTPADKMKTALVLYGNPDTQAPTTYWLGRVVVQGEGAEGHRVEVQGTWTVRTGVQGYPGAMVYMLDAQTPEDMRLYWRVNEDILLPLEKDMRPKVGNASWGYMLSRIR